MELNELALIDKKHVIRRQRLIKKILGLVFVLLGSGIMFYLSLNTKTETKLSYTENSDINYWVYLEDNDFYETPYLTKGMQYIAALIDYINVNFEYTFDMNTDFQYEYKYYIESDVKVFKQDDESNIIYQKKEILVEDVIYANQDNDMFTVSEDLKIDYSEYNDLVRSFKTSYNVVADSNVTLTLYVFIDGTYKEFTEPIRNNSNLSLEIDLSEQMTDIAMDYIAVNNSDEISLVSKSELSNQIYLIISGILGFVSLIILADIIYYVAKVMNQKTPYQKLIDKILREYDQVIVEAKTNSTLDSDVNLIMVDNFDEILDASDRLEQPILYFEVEKDEKSHFIVRKGKDTYSYTLRAKDVNEVE